MIPELFAENIKHLRSLKNLTQTEMADSIGFSIQKWNNYERGVSLPKLEDLEKISNYFGVTETDLLHTEISLSDLIEVYDNYKKPHKSDRIPDRIPDLKVILPKNDTLGSHSVGEPDHHYGAQKTSPNSAHQLLEAKDTTIQALYGQIAALKQALRLSYKLLGIEDNAGL